MHIFAKLSLANRSVVALATAIIAAFGLISLSGLKQELIPSFETPQAAVVTSLPGASPEIIDQQISQPLENAIRQQEGLIGSTSTSQSSLSIIRVEFDYGTKTADVSARLNAAVAAVEATLPEGASARVISGSFDSVPIIALGISANDGNNEALGKKLEDIAAPLLAEIPGVRDVTVSGVQEKRINLELKQSVLAANGLSQQSIVSALQANGFIVPAGTIDDSEGSIAVQVGTAINSIEDFKNLPLIGSKTVISTPSAASGGSLSGIPSSGIPTGAFPGATLPTASALSAAPTVTTRTVVLSVADVATVSYENAPVSNISRINGKAALTISITKNQDANTVSVSHAVEEKLADLEQQLGDVTIVTVFDQAPFVEKSLENLTTEGLLGLGFAILIILLFLLSVRSTLVTAISIPTSVLITFIGLSGFDYSLNLFTLSALTIAIGRVVDDSIVVIENINRHLSYGEEKKQAILTAVREVAGAITAATITTVAVFLPIALVEGLVGELFRPFSFTFAIALVASLAVSLTIVPVLAYWFLKSPKIQTGENQDEVIAKVRELEEEKERKSWLQRGYLPVLSWTQRRPVVTLVASFLVLVFTFGLVPQLKTDFIGSSGSNSFVINQTLAPGATLAQKDEAAAKLEKLILDREEVEVVQTTIGSAADGRVAFGAQTGGTSLQVTTIEGTDQTAFQAELESLFQADSSLGTVEFSSGGGGGFGGSSTIDIKITAADESKLEAAIADVEKAMSGTPNVSAIENSLAERKRTLQVTVDREKAANKGLTEITVGGIVSGIMRPSSIGSLNIDGVATDIYVVREDVPETITEVKNIEIPSATGIVKLSEIASVRLSSVPVSITTEKGERTATVSLTPDGDNLGAITAEVTERLDSVDLPAGTKAEIGGVSASQAESFGQLGTALLAAVAIVFVVMVATFSSIIQPLILLISIPFAATGALGLLLITDTALGVPALIGMLLLVGIVVTNAIVLIDLINQYRKDGMPTQQAIMDGARQRLRPILMTALATIFALTPMALGVTGGGGFISQPLAIVVIGGLFSSTVLTLVIVPVLYWLVEGRKERRAERKSRRAARLAEAAAKKVAPES